MQETPQRRIGRYQIVDEIGLGAMGTVYKAFDPLIKRHLAIKTIRVDVEVGSEAYTSFLERFHQEARIAGTLNHPNIITIYDIGEEEGIPFLAFELVEGEPLSKLLEAKTPFSPRDVILIVAQIANALDYAHSRSIVHRDIKPSNILVHSNNRVKVLDFGISKFGDADLTQPGVRLGTPCYMSPEQALGEKVDLRSDLFSLAALAFEMLTGVAPFEGDSTTAVLYNIVHNEPLRVGNLDALGLLESRWEAVFQKALAKDRERRYQRGEEFVRALWECQKQQDRSLESFVQESLDAKRPLAAPVPERTVVLAQPAAAAVAPAPPPPLVLAAPPVPPPPPAASVQATVVLDRESRRRTAAEEAEEPTRLVAPPLPPVTAPTPAPPKLLTVAAPPVPSVAPPQAATPVAAMVEVPPVTPAVKRPASGSRLFIFAAIALFAVALAGGGWYVYTHRTTPAPPSESTSASQPEPVPTPSERVSEAPPATPQSGSLEMRSTPESASVYVDGEARGVTPVTISGLPIGQHALRFELKGYQTVEQTQEIVAETGSPQVVEVSLKPEGAPAETTGGLRIASVPPGATVVLDGRDMGTTPKVLLKLRPGRHVLELKRDGYISWVGQPVVKAGKQQEVIASLQEIPPPPPPPPPPKPVPTETGPLELGPGISFDRKLVSGKQPESPRTPSGRSTGSVLVKIVVGVSGAVEKVEVQQSGGPSLDHAVMNTVSKWVYRPATRNGVPVRVFFLYRFTFK